MTGRFMEEDAYSNLNSVSMAVSKSEMYIYIFLEVTDYKKRLFGCSKINHTEFRHSTDLLANLL